MKRPEVNRTTFVLIRAVLVSAALLALISVPLSLHRLVQTQSVATLFLPGAESVLLFCIMLFLSQGVRNTERIGRAERSDAGAPSKRAAVLGGSRRRWLIAAAALFLAVLMVFSAAEALFQFIYARPFDPAADIPMVRGGLLLLFGEIGALADTLTPIAIMLILLIAGALSALLILTGVSLLRRYGLQLPPLVPTAALLVPVVLALLSPQLLFATMVRSLTGEGDIEFVDVMERATTTERPDGQEDAEDRDAADAEAAAAKAYAFPGILDRDIYVFVIEAYGYAAFSRDDLYNQLKRDYDRFAEVLEKHGYGIKSNYLLAPVAGGFSWLAEATFLSGQWINSQTRFEQLYDASVSTLSGVLHEGGYYTFTVRPGTVHGQWPEGWDLYRFEDALVAYEGDFGYRGPGFSYVPITDQYAVWKAHHHLEDARDSGLWGEDRPLLVYYQLVSSHTPFNRIPPFIENWEELGDGSIYHERSDEILTFNNTWGGGTELDEGFVASISYVFTVLTDYIDRFVDHSRDPVFIVFGDHQPQRPIREQDAHLSVPIHIASRDAEILERFAARGFEPGMRGKQEPPHARMSEFFPMFVDIATDDGPAIVQRHHQGLDQQRQSGSAAGSAGQ